jgi:hypothetical protein
MRQRWQDIVFALLVIVAAGIAVFAGLVLSGNFVSDGTEATRAVPRSEPPLPPPTRTTQPEQTVAQTTTVPRVQIAATRGDCWVAASKGSRDGPPLVARVLREGETVTLRGRRIFLELGAAGNVDVSVNGKARPIPSGTANVVVG